MTERKLMGDGLAVAQDHSERSGIAADFGVALVGMAKEIVGAGAAESVLAKIARNALGGGIPEDDLAVTIDEIDTGLNAIEDTAIDVRSVK
jgi:hypothetical protein